MVDGDALRSVMRPYPHGVAVLTVDRDGDRMGVTVSSLVSLSLDPPLVGVAVGEHAAALELVRGAGAFALSLLGAGQESVAHHFARGVPPLVHWHGVSMREGSVAPLLDDSLGWLECRVAAEHPAGDHVLFVGEVLAAERGEARPALVYREHAYHSL